MKTELQAALFAIVVVVAGPAAASTDVRAAACTKKISDILAKRGHADIAGPAKVAEQQDPSFGYTKVHVCLSSRKDEIARYTTASCTFNAAGEIGSHSMTTGGEWIFECE